MSFALLNPWMLLGLAGVALPVIAHLLSKKKYDIVSWGAMQFLKLGQETRRRVWLEDLWLLLLRMALIAWLVIALGRPWVSAKWLGEIGPQPNRDVVIILDGSYSTAWEATSVTPQELSVRWIDKFLGQLRPGDTVTLLEAREQVRTLIDPPTRDVNRVREVLKQLPPPTGTGNFPEALAHAVKLLSRTNHPRREVILLTDGQAQGWFAEDSNLWLRLDDLKKQSSVTPHLWVVNVLDSVAGDDQELPPPTERLNFHVERLQPSRELSVPGFPVRFQSRVRFSGGSTGVTRQVHFEVDGQRLAERTVSVTLAPGGEANVEFEQRFEALGSHLVRVALDADDLPADNASDAVIVVTAALPVLLVDGDPRPEAVQSETFFVRAALAASGNETPWVQPTVVKWSEWTPQFQAVAPTTNDLDKYAVVILANVPEMTDAQFAALTDYVKRGGGVGLALGNRVVKERYSNQIFAEETGLLGIALEEIESEPEEQREQGVFIANATLESPWLQRFRAERGAAFTTARFNRWWKVTIAPKPAGEPGGVSPRTNNEPETDEDHPDKQQPAVVLARLQTGAPYLIGGQFGRGNVMLLTSPLDADWNTLLAKPDFVAFVHEWLFQLASRRGERNVVVGQPLVGSLPPLKEPADAGATTGFVFEGPDGEPRAAKLSGEASSPLLLLDDTSLPGVYSLRRQEPADEPRLSGKAVTPETNKPAPPRAAPGRELFVVNADRAESNLTPLSAEQIALITAEERLQFIREGREIQAAASSELPRHELWQLLFLAFLALLVGEVLMTRKLVRGGHATADADPN
ncbi:MAG: BatA domain-containing protein [Planctomycetaceae bacterium]